mgnify:CR=1 FL=1
MKLMVKYSYRCYEGVFREVRIPRKFKSYRVNIMLELLRCHDVFNYHYGISSEDGKVSEPIIRVKSKLKQ